MAVFYWSVSMEYPKVKFITAYNYSIMAGASHPFGISGLELLAAYLIGLKTQSEHAEGE
jgi:hypothetical protein